MTDLKDGINPEENIPSPDRNSGNFPSKDIFIDRFGKNLTTESYFSCPKTMKMSKNRQYCYAISYWLNYQNLQYEYIRSSS